MSVTRMCQMMSLSISVLFFAGKLVVVNIRVGMFVQIMSDWCYWHSRRFFGEQCIFSEFSWLNCSLCQCLHLSTRFLWIWSGRVCELLFIVMCCFRQRVSFGAQAVIGEQEACLVQTGSSLSFLSVPSGPSIANIPSRSLWTSACRQFSKRAWGALAALSLPRAPSISHCWLSLISVC